MYLFSVFENAIFSYDASFRLVNDEFCLFLADKIVDKVPFLFFIQFLGDENKRDRRAIGDIQPVFLLTEQTDIVSGIS